MTVTPRGLRAHPQRKPVLAGIFAAALLGGYQAPGAQEVWISDQSALWSNAASWLDGTAPDAGEGGNPSLELVFSPRSSSTSTTSRNDLPGTFTLNRLTLDSYSASMLTIDDMDGSSLRFDGTDPAIEMKGTGNVTIRSPFASTTGVVTIRHTGLGSLYIGNAFGGTQSLVIEGDSTRTGSYVVLDNSNTSTGGVVLKSGNLSVRSDSAFGTGQLTAEGGKLLVDSFSRAIKLNGNLTIDSASTTGTLSSVISELSPGRGITIHGRLPLTGASTFSGATNVEPTLSANNIATAGYAILSGTGSLLNTSAINVRDGSTLRMEALSTGSSNHVGDSTPINLHAGELLFAGTTGTTPQLETVGPINVTGYSTVSVASAGSASLKLTAASLNRNDRATVLIRGTGLGSTRNLLLGSAPTGLIGGGAPGANTSILPWAIASDTSATGAGSTLVTYNTNSGIIPLNLTTQFVSSLSSSAATNNVSIVGLEVISAPRTINSLAMSGGGIQGSHPLTITSGVILQRMDGVINAPLDFGPTEANIFTVANLHINGAITGSNGLTKSSPGTLALSGENTFTGPLRVNAGIVTFLKPENLGADSSAIVLAGSGAGLSYDGENDLTFSRPIETRMGIARVETGGKGNLSLSSPITGAGGMNFSPVSGTTITLPSGSSYTGPTQVASGQVIIGDDTAFGGGGDLHLSDSTLTLTGAWTSSRNISLKLAVVNTAGFDATWSGPTVGTQLTKTGDGTLHLSAPSRLGYVIVEKGTLDLTGNSSLPATATELVTYSGGELRLDNTSTVHENRISDDAILVSIGGALTIAGNSASPVVETIGRLAVAVRHGTSSVTLGAPGNQSVSLHINRTLDTYAESGLVIRAANLGGAAPGVFQRLVVKQSPPSGFVNRIYAASGANGIGDSFVVYDNATDAAGIIGFRPLKQSEYFTNPLLSNPSNGGSIPTDAHFLATGAVTTAGLANTIQSLTLDPGTTLTLSPGHNLEVTSGQILSRAGENKVTINQGNLSFSSGRAEIYAGGDLEISSAIQGTGLWKAGPGKLTLQPGSIAYSGKTTVLDGVLEVGEPSALAARELFVHGPGTFAVGGSTVSLGSIGGNGTLTVGGGTLILGTSGTDFTFDGKISGSGQIVITDGGISASLRQLNGSSSFTGPIALQSGRLSLGSNTALGTSTLTVSGGSLRAAAPITIAPTIQMQTDLLLRGTEPITLSEGTAITGSHDVRLEGTGTLNIETPLALAGKLIVRPDTSDEFYFRGGRIAIQGAAGSITSTTGISIEGGAFLTLSYAGGYKGPTNARIPDAVPITFRSGNLELVAGPTSNAIETLGPLQVGGTSRFRVTPTGATSAILTAASIERIERAGVHFENTTAALNGASGQILFGVPPVLVGGNGTGASTSIIPWAVGSDPSSVGFVTYGPNGIRRLLASEYVPFDAAASNLNVSLAATTTNNNTVSMNALRISAAALNGTGTLQITSGAVLQNFSATTITNNLDFGNVEGHFHFPFGSSLTLSGVISGSSGLTQTGGRLIVSGNNTFSGPITINSGTLEINSVANLGANAGDIVLNGRNFFGSESALSFTQNGLLTLNRNIHVAPGTSRIEISKSSGFLDIAGQISGDGGLEIADSGTIRFSGSSSLAGAIRISRQARLGPNAVVGSGGFIFAPGSTLTLEGPWTTNSRIAFSYVGEFPTAVDFDTNGFNAVLQGALVDTPPTFPNESRVTLIKKGAGILSVTSRTAYGGDINAAEGEFRLSGNGSLASQYLATTGGILSLDNSANPSTNRISDTATVALSVGEFRFVGNSAIPTNETIGKLTAGFGSNVVSLNASGAGSTMLSIGELSLDGNQILFRGTNLGGNSAPYSRIVFRTTPALSNGLIAGAFTSTTPNGEAESFAVYDSGTDGVGQIGIRPLTASEITTGTEIRNPANGGATPITANFNASQPVTAGGAINKINSLQLSGSAALNLDPAQTLQIGAPGLLVQSAAVAAIQGGTLSVEGSEAPLYVAGQLSLSSRITNSSVSKLGPGTLELRPESRIAGTLNLAAGTLKFSGNSLLGTNITAKSGTQIDVTGDAVVNEINGPTAINLSAGVLRVDSLLSDQIISVTGAGGLSLGGTGTTAKSPWTYSGPTTIRNGYLLLSENGSLSATSSLTIRGGGSIDLVNSTNPKSRLGTFPIELNSSSIIPQDGPVQVTEDLGIVTVRGTSSIGATFGKVDSVSALISFAGLNRADRASLNFPGISSSGADTVRFPTSLASDLVGAGGPTSAPILPYAFAVKTMVSPLPYGFATMTPSGGIRLLAGSEYTAALTSGQNVSASSSLTNDAIVSINSLFVTNRISGSGTLQIASGAVLYGFDAEISNTLDFGAREAHFAGTRTLDLFGGMIGSGGLTLAGPGVLVPSSNNQITGPVTINGGTLRYRNSGSLGTDASELILNDGTLEYDGVGELVFAKPIHLNGTSPTVKVGSGDVLRVTQPIEGSDEVSLTKTGDGKLVFSNAPEFFGKVTVATGSLEVNGSISAQITTSAGATLTGSAIANAVDVGGILEPGFGVGDFSTTSLELRNGATIRLEIIDKEQTDLITASSSVTLGDNVQLELQLQSGYNPLDGVDLFYVVKNDSDSAVSKSTVSPLVFAGNALDEGEIFFASGQSWQLSYAGGDGNDVVIAAVPEPNIAALMAVAAALGLTCRRDRKRMRR